MPLQDLADTARDQIDQVDPAVVLAGAEAADRQRLPVGCQVGAVECTQAPAADGLVPSDRIATCGAAVPAA